MSKTTNTKWGYLEDTATDLTIANVPKIDYANDFAVRSQEANSIVLQNTTSAIGQPETLKFQIQDIANVYSNTDVDPTLYAPIKKGKSVVCSVQDTMRVENATTGEVVMYPVSAHFVLKFPNTSDIADSDIMHCYKRMAALAFKNADDTSRLAKLVRGALNPLQ